ncbi:hypothetical protein BK666_07460 [Pseudomonas frederiksbergensis]|uniref:Uncharacterized protein n=1 Tax=Pseudomonas frederiksbergensis TaxID=104087 RepID=A0A423KAH5_9PSED|nr:hypothetical protein [Pseudomonas frederiksbergensis]RON49102.1 hypothetical protein BK666_07460 [Pseudomonas frederiksbergensis]
MLTQPSINLAPQALIEPQIPDRTELQLPSGEWGINLAAATGNHPEKGLKVWIPVWSQKGVGDKVELLLDNAMIDQHVISDAVEVNVRTTLWVAPEAIEAGSHTLSYRVTRLNQAPEPLESPLRLLIKLDVPGGQDQDPEEGRHSGLYMEIDPEILRDGVNEDNVGDGIDITIKAKPGAPSKIPYPDIAVGDVCTLSWGGHYVFSAPVTQDQIDKPDLNPLVIHVSKQTILDTKDTGPEGLAVTFRVKDRVDNVSTDWCEAAHIKVKLGTSPLPAPIISNTDGYDLHLDTLEGEDLQVMVWAESIDEFKHEDTIIVSLAGNTYGGEPQLTQVRQTINNTPPTLVFLKLPNVAARALAKTQVSCYYAVERNGAIVQTSPSRFINFIGEIEQLAAPLVEDEEDGSLDPDLTNIEINIPFNKDFAVEDAIELNWFGLRPNLSTYNPELEWYFPSEDELQAEEGFFIPVEGKHLKTLEGGTLTLSYNQLRAGEGDDIIRRPSLEAQTLDVGERQFELDKPIVQGEQDGVLEPEDLPGGITKLTVPNPADNPTKRGDTVTFTWVGEASGETEQSKPITALTEGKNVDFPLNAAFVAEHIEANRGKTVNVKYQILRVATGKPSFSNSLEFTVGR